MWLKATYTINGDLQSFHCLGIQHIFNFSQYSIFLKNDLVILLDDHVFIKCFKNCLIERMQQGGEVMSNVMWHDVICAVA